MSLDAPAIPCGLVAKSYFNDTFKLYLDKGGSGNLEEQIIKETHIAWSSDLDFKFANIKENEIPKDKDGNAGKY